MKRIRERKLPIGLKTKSEKCKNKMEDLMRALPDNRPVTSICIVEDPGKCPAGFQVVDKTFDQDTDADLWKDGFFRRITRYICISKQEWQTNEVIESLTIIGEKDSPPDDFTLLMYTRDTEQRATRKKHLCYKLMPRDNVQIAVTDVIVLSRWKKPPAGFTLAGEMNSLLICYKLGSVSSPKKSIDGALPYPVYPGNENFQGSVNWSNSNKDSQNYRSLGSVLDDIPFDINPKYKDLFNLTKFILPEFNIKSEEELNAECSYDFHAEQQAQQAIPSHLA
ncbi:multivesicular body subunit 12B isoform X1 [Centruroides vittatus]|uniref:multivesicular body subunit 12B isoform X1 n=2 Tax=Centruroides vittatus TaxID=120091 RepID=UPI00350F3774